MFWVLLIFLFSGPGCSEFEEIPGQRVPLGDVSRDYWSQISMPFADPVAFDAASGVIAIASPASLAISSDEGDSWNAREISSVSYISVYKKNPSRILALQGKKLFVSQDKGTSFSERIVPDSFVMVLQHPALESTLLAISDTALWRSADLGTTWDLVYIPPENPRLSLLALDPLDTSYMYLVDAGGLRISSDGGKKWDSKTYFEQDSVTHLKTSTNGVFVGTGGFIRFSSSHGNADSWYTYGPYFSTPPELADFLVIDDETILYACFVEVPGEYQAYITRDLNVHWSNASPGLIGFQGTLALARSNKNYYALVTSGQRNFLFRFKDTELFP